MDRPSPWPGPWAVPRQSLWRPPASGNILSKCLGSSLPCLEISQIPWGLAGLQAGEREALHSYGPWNNPNQGRMGESTKRPSSLHPLHPPPWVGSRCLPRGFLVGRNPHVHPSQMGCLMAFLLLLPSYVGPEFFSHISAWLPSPCSGLSGEQGN